MACWPPTTAWGYGVYSTSNHIALYANAPNYGLVATSNQIGVQSQALGTSGVTYGVHAQSHSSSGYGIYSYNSAGGRGIKGYSSAVGGIGVEGHSIHASGVFGHSQNYIGVFGSTSNSYSYAGFFNGNVFTYGTYQSSDRSLKKDILELEGALELIGQLKPKSYQFRRDGSYRLMNLPGGQHYGLLAQEVEAVLPALVKNTQFSTCMVYPQDLTGPEGNSESGQPKKSPTKPWSSRRLTT